MHKILPRLVDTVVIGTGPSALIISYILHGHIPVYNLESPHRDPLLHERLKDSTNLLDLDVDCLTEHFGSSRFSYSTQALPINVLFDTLLRPLGETDGDVDNETCVKWIFDPSKAVPHIVVGNTVQTGGQWESNPVKASWDIGTLSYASMLSLPGYSFADFYKEHYGKRLPFYSRPSRRDVAEYFAAYPSKVGIQDSIFNNTTFSGIRRNGLGFCIASHDIYCDHLVLASGTFTSPIPPRPLLQPLISLPSASSSSAQEPLLVIGSGFSAADVIISTSPSRRIIHIYKWAPSTNPSPLRACHANAYPEYAGVYRKMKQAAISGLKPHTAGRRPSARRASSSAFDLSRNWQESYEGLPNTQVIDVQVQEGGGSANVTLKNSTGDIFQRKVGGLAYVIGRRGSLQYLDRDLQKEVCPRYDATIGLSGRDMRDLANEDLEVADNVFITGSLTGDTLIRFAYGGCAYAAGKIMRKSQAAVNAAASNNATDDNRCSLEDMVLTDLEGVASSTGSRSGRCSGRCSGRSSSGSGNGSPSGGYVKTMTGFDGHHLFELHRD